MFFKSRAHFTPFFFSNSGVSFEQILSLQRERTMQYDSSFGSNRVIIMFLALIVARLNNGVLGRVSNRGIHLHSLLLWGFQSSHRLQKPCGDTIVFYLLSGLNTGLTGNYWLLCFAFLGSSRWRHDCSIGLCCKERIQTGRGRGRCIEGVVWHS